MHLLSALIYATGERNLGRKWLFAPIPVENPRPTGIMPRCSEQCCTCCATRSSCHDQSDHCSWIQDNPSSAIAYCIGKRYPENFPISAVDPPKYPKGNEFYRMKVTTHPCTRTPCLDASVAPFSPMALDRL